MRDSRGRWLPGHSGNAKGRPPSKFSKLMAELRDNEKKALLRRLYELGMAGDPTALRLCIERIDPVPRGRPVNLPELKEAATPAERLSIILAALGDGSLTPDECGKLADLAGADRIPLDRLQATLIKALEQVAPEVHQEFMALLTEARRDLQ